MRPLNEREKIILFITLIVLFISLVISVLGPMREKEKQLQEGIFRAENILSRDSSLIKHEPELNAEYQGLLIPFAKKGADEKVISVFLSEIESLASELGMRIVNIKPGNVDQNDFYNRFYIELTTEGQFKDIMHFLYTLQEGPHYFRVEKVQLEKNKALSKVDCQVSLSRLFVHN